jgi:hypothetical protein
MGYLWPVLVPKEQPRIAARDGALTYAPTTDQLSGEASLGETRTASPIEIAFAHTDNAKDALRILHEALDAGAFQPHGNDLAAIPLLCRALAQRWPHSPEAISAHKLMSRRYAQLGERERAIRSFFDYADAASQPRDIDSSPRPGTASPDTIHRRKAITLVQEEVERLFAEGEYFFALTYCDALQTRYPGVEMEHYAAARRALYYVTIRAYAQARVEYERIAASQRASSWTRQAMLQLPGLYALCGQHDRVKAAYERRAIACCSDNADDAARLYCGLGMYMEQRGIPGYVDAVEAYTVATRSHPNSVYASLSKRMLARLTMRVSRELGTVTDTW